MPNRGPLSLQFNSYDCFSEIPSYDIFHCFLTHHANAYYAALTLACYNNCRVFVFVSAIGQGGAEEIVLLVNAQANAEAILTINVQMDTGNYPQTVLSVWHVIPVQMLGVAETLDMQRVTSRFETDFSLVVPTAAIPGVGLFNPDYIIVDSLNQYAHHFPPPNIYYAVQDTGPTGPVGYIFTERFFPQAPHNNFFDY